MRTIKRRLAVWSQDSGRLREMRHRPLAFVDLETTGLSPGADRVVEIGIVTVDDGNVEEWTSLVHPGRRVSRVARSYTGISDDMLADARRALARSPAMLHAVCRAGCSSPTTRASTMLS